MRTSAGAIWVLSAAVVAFLAQRIDAQPTAAQILSEMHWSQDDQARVLDGEFVMNDVSAVTPRDLSVRMAFLVKLAPDELFRRVLAGDFIADPQVVTSGEFVGAGSLSDLRADTAARNVERVAQSRVADHELGVPARPREAARSNGERIIVHDGDVHHTHRLRCSSIRGGAAAPRRLIGDASRWPKRSIGALWRPMTSTAPERPARMPP